MSLGRTGQSRVVRAHRRAGRATLIAVSMLGFGPGAGAALAALPSEATGVISNGDDRIALFTAGGDGVAVYDPATGSQVGATTALPRTARGRPFQLFTAGLVSGRVYLAGLDPDLRPAPGQGQDHIAVADSATGAFRWLCAPPNTPEGAGVPKCMQQFINGPYLSIAHIGRRWMSVRADDFRLTLVRYSDAGGTFTQRSLTQTERRRFDRDVPKRSRDSPLNLDAERVTLDRRWGYRRSLSQTSRGKFGTPSYRGGQRVKLARSGDRRLARIDVLQSTPISTLDVNFGVRGMCASTGARAILWDKSTSRVWRRAIPAGAVATNIACTRSNVLMSVGASSNFSAAGLTLGPLSTWPTTKRPAGWTRGPKLDPGDKRTY